MHRDVLICSFVQQGEHCVCPVCGRKLTKSQYPCERHYATCRSSESQPNGLGDRIENWLSSHGITEDRYKEIKQKFGLPANCGCEKRKQWFNEVGAYLGISADTYGPNKETK